MPTSRQAVNIVFLLGIAAFSNIPTSHVLGIANRKAPAYFIGKTKTPLPQE